MATIESYETASGKRYMVRYRTPERAQTKKRGFRTKRDAEAFAASTEVSKLKGEYIDPGAARALVRDLGAEWLRRQTHMKPSAYRSIESAWRIHVAPRWGTVAVSEIRKTAVHAWVSELSADKSPTTVIRCHGVLASILDDAVDDRRVLVNPARGINLPRKLKKEHVYLSHAQVEALAAESGRHAIVIGTPKSHERRSVPFPAFLSEPLAAQCVGKGRDDVVFTGDRGGYLKRSRTGKGWFWRAASAAGVEEAITPHDLRHTAASLSVSAGANVKAVQRMLGHASASMTLDVYADLFDDDLDGVAVALDEARLREVVPKTCPHPG